MVLMRAMLHDLAQCAPCCIGSMDEVLTGLLSRNDAVLPIERVPCSLCGRKRLLYCYSPSCLTSLYPNIIPHVQRLPLKLHIVHHRSEDLSRSTAVHAKVIAPESTELHVDDVKADVIPVPEFDPETTLALFPSPNAQTLKEIGKDKLKQMKAVVLVDGTWVKAHASVERANIKNVVHVKLKEYKTMFWRYQRVGEQDDSQLSSIEAVYYFFKEYAQVMAENEEEWQYDGRFDNLMYLFAWQRKLVETKHENDSRENSKLLRIKRKADDTPEEQSNSKRTK